MKKISVSLSGHHTSISLEPEFIDALNEIALRQKKTVSEIINQIDKSRASQNLSGSVRVWILKNYK